MNSQPKFVVSRILSEPLSWQNSTLIKGDVASRLRQLKSEIERDILVIGSGDLAQTLMANGLVDECSLMVYPSCWARASGSSAMPTRLCGCA